MDHDILETLNLFVGLGFYHSRSEAIRELMKKGLEAHEDVKKLGRVVKVIGRLDRDGKIDLPGLVLERDRL